MDREELRSQLERYHAESFGWALSCCSRDADRAEEVLQIVYLKILEGRAHFGQKSAFRTWLFSVIRKTAAHEWRRALWRRMRFVEFTDDEIPSQNNPETEVEVSELQALFQRALGDLPRRQRQVLDLVFYHEFTIAEAAAVLGISVGSARTHYERGKNRLRQWLEEHHVFERQGREHTGALSSAETGR